MNKETVDEVVNAILPLHNNLAARFSVLYRHLQNDVKNIKHFEEKSIFKIRKDVKKIKKDLDPNIFKKAIEICDYFESVYLGTTLF